MKCLNGWCSRDEFERKGTIVVPQSARRHHFASGEAVINGGLIKGCQCSTYGDVESLISRQEFVSGLEVCDHSAKLWEELCRCPKCGQYWGVQRGAEVDRRANLAFKVDSPAAWPTLDRRKLIRALAIREAGGLSNDICLQAGCSERAVRGLVFCIDHSQLLGRPA